MVTLATVVTPLDKPPIIAFPEPPKFEPLDFTKYGLPRGTRFYKSTGPTIKRARIRFVIETAPQRATLTFNFDHDYPRTRRESVEVQLPWTYLLAEIDTYGYKNPYVRNTYIYWAKERIKTLDDVLIAAVLPNVTQTDRVLKNGASAYICVGTTISLAGNDYSTLLGKLETFTRAFYESDFTDHLNGWRYPHTYANLAAWHKASEENPLCFLEWNNWLQRVRYGITPRQYLSRKWSATEEY